MAQTAPVAGAAPATGPDAESAPAATATEDIIVTARGRGERLMSVPVVVTAQGAPELARANATNLGAIGDLTPTVIIATYKGNAGGSLAIRGISSPANQTGFEQAVSVAIDGVQTSNGRIAQLGQFDVQQVEVLKGPQALFFGKNNTAGVIAISSADPTRTFQMAAKTSYEFVADETLNEAWVSGPITSTLSARFAARYRYMDGWLRNTAQPIANPFYNPASGAPASSAFLPGTHDPRPGDDELLGRLTLLWNPSSAFTARLKLMAGRATDSGPGTNSQNIGPCLGGVPRVYGIADPNAECVVDNRTTIGDVPTVIAQSIHGISTDGTKPGVLTARIASLDLTYSTDAFDITSTSGLNYTRYLWFGGIDQTTYSQLAQSEDQKQWEYSEQLRLSTKFDGPLNFMVGAYYQRVNLSVHYNLILNDGNYQASTGRWSSAEKYAYQSGNTYSAFAQARYQIVPSVELAGGLRYTREDKTMRQYNVYGIGSFNTLTTNFAGSDEPGVLKGRFSDSNLSPEATLTWHPSRDQTLFVAYKTGFKSGGFGLTQPLQKTTVLSAVDFDSEKAKGFEVGAKGLFMDGKLRLSFAAFAYTFSNLQVNTYDPTLIAYTINNAGEVRQRGAELEANYRIDSMFSVHGAVAYVRNRFHDFVGQCYSYAFPTGATRATATPPPNCSFVNATSLTLQQNYEGKAPARSPEWSGNAGFLAEIPIGSRQLTVSGDALYSDSYYAAETLVSSSYQPAFWRLNSSVGFGPADERWKVSFVGRNLTNKYYLVYAADRTGGASVPGQIGEQRGVVARGRELAMQVAVKF